MVLRKLKGILRYYYIRHCKSKKLYNLFDAVDKIQIFKNDNITIYKCKFCKKYHIGNTGKYTEKTNNYIDKNYKMLLVNQ